MCNIMSVLCDLYRISSVNLKNVQHEHAKMHIYCCKFQNIVLGIEGFAKIIADIKNIEKYIAVKINKIQAFNQKCLISDPTAL